MRISGPGLFCFQGTSPEAAGIVPRTPNAGPAARGKAGIQLARGLWVPATVPKQDQCSGDNHHPCSPCQPQRALVKAGCRKRCWRGRWCCRRWRRWRSRRNRWCRWRCLRSLGANFHVRRIRIVPILAGLLRYRGRIRHRLALAGYAVQDQFVRELLALLFGLDRAQFPRLAGIGVVIEDRHHFIGGRCRLEFQRSLGTDRAGCASVQLAFTVFSWPV